MAENLPLIISVLEYVSVPLATVKLLVPIESLILLLNLYQFTKLFILESNIGYVLFVSIYVLLYNVDISMEFRATL